MYFATCPKLFRARPVIFAFFSRPKAVVEDHIHSQFQRPASYFPEESLDQDVSRIVFRFLGILAEETYVQLIKVQSKRRQFMFKLLRERCFS